MERQNKRKPIGKVALILCNAVLMMAAVLFTLFYSHNVKASQERLMLENFCTTVDTMKKISQRYLTDELVDARNWVDYIEAKHMSIEEALEYMRLSDGEEDREAHIVDMDTYEAWSTKVTNGSNLIGRYLDYFESEEPLWQEYCQRMQKMFRGEQYLLGKYLIRESQRSVISVGVPVKLRLENGMDKDYLLLRVVPVDRMRELWLFPTSYTVAEIGLIAKNGDYVINSNAMRSENFMEFVRSYSFPENYNGADEELAQLKQQQSGLMVLNNSRGEKCYWYYSALDEFEDLDILGYIPVRDLAASGEDLSIVVGVAGVLVLLALLDGAYILNINRRLRAAAEIARNASDAKTQFLSSMSHDIRTPLNAVLGMTKLAQAHMEDTDYVRECLRKISLSGNHLLTLINDILEISRVESGKIYVNPAPFAVQELVSNLESITRSQAVGHGLELEVNLDDPAHPYLMGDKLRLTQVYLNLLNNAIKYTQPGGKVRLLMKEEDLGGEGVILTCMVEDTGIGMSPEFQKTMYDSFTRVADSRIDKIQGTGLGLAIVKRMVALMNGTIQCVSAEGEGTTFTVRIPLTKAAELPHSTQVPEGVSSGDLTGVKLLVAEDNDMNWEVVSELLGVYGIRCDRAENGRVCVDMLNAAPEGTYDLVMMDVQMPVLNGRDAARALRTSAREDLRRIPIMAMTADAFAEDVQMCLDAGMDAHVAKPIELDKVLSTIRLLLARKNSADERT